MSRYLKQLLFAALFLLASPLHTSPEPLAPPLQVEAVPGEEGIILGISMDLPPGWHFYAPAPAGHPQQGFPPELELEQGSGTLLWPPARTLSTDLGPAIGYTGKVRIPALIDSDTLSTDRVKGTFRALVCKDLCIPITHTFDTDVLQGSPREIRWRHLAEQSQPNAPEVLGSLWAFMLLSFLGGVILNVMPCVLPVLALKMVGIAKTGLHRKRLYATILGILFTFLCIGGALLALRTLGAQVGWGIHFQSPGFVGVMAILMVLFANNLMGHFHFDPFQALSGRLYQSVQKKQGFLTDFSLGILATLLATPCTAPFLGTAIGFALTQDAASILLVFLMMGVGFALPYFLLAILPRRFHVAPKPGPWMVRVKEICALLLFATAGWLLSVLAALSTPAIALTLLVAAIAFTGFFARTWRRWVMTGCIAAAALFWGASRLSDHPQSIWHPLNTTEIKAALSQGRPVFIDITAKWCITCQANKMRVLNTPETSALFERHHVYLVRADWTLQDERISAFLKRYKRAGIPFNMLLIPQEARGHIFSELISYAEIARALDQDTPADPDPAL